MSLRMKIVGILAGLIIVVAIAVPIVFASSWSAFNVTSDSVENSDPALALHGGKAYVVYVRGKNKNTEIYLRTNVSGKWAGATRLTNNTTADWAPDIAIDAQGKIHVAYLFDEPSSGGKSELIYKTNLTGKWTTKRLTSNRVKEWNPSIAVYKGKAHIVYGRSTPTVAGEIWYSTNASGKWVSRLISRNAYAQEPGALALTLQGKPHIVYRDQMLQRCSYEGAYPEQRDDEIFYVRQNANWNISRITFNSSEDATPDIAIDSRGKAHVVLSRGDPTSLGSDSEIIYLTNKSGFWKETRLTNDSVGDGSPSIAVNGGKIFVAWHKWDQARYSYEIYMRQNNGSGWTADQRLTNNTVSDMLPSIAAWNGKSQLVYLTYNPTGNIIFKKNL